MPKDHLPEVGPDLQKLPPDRLYMEGATQPRGRLDDDVVERYAEAMVAGLWDFNKSSAPITAFSNARSKTYWLADGFHRVAAAKKAGLACVEVDIRQGGEREAKWFSFGVNAEHGYARGKDDVARILKAIFEDTEWRAIPLREISRHTRIPFETVRRHHEKIAASDPVGQIDKPVTRTVNRGGTTYTMDVGAIGGKSKPPALSETSAVQIEVGSTETERDGVGDVTDLGQVQAADDAKPAAKPVEQEYDSGTQALLKRYLSQNDFPSIVRHPARQMAAAARMFTPKTLAKVRQRMERRRQWLTDFLAALDDAAATAEAAEAALSMSAQEKLDAAIRAHRRKLEIEFEAKVQEQCRQWAEDMRLPLYEKRLKDMERMLIYPSKGVMTKSEYNKIVLCLHPDALNSRTKEQLAEAFRLFTHYKLKMVDDEEERRQFMSTLPRTVEEMLARKKKR